MKLRNGKIVEKQIVKKYVESFQSDFLNIFYSIKNKFKYCDLHNNPTEDTKYTICNLYAGFKAFINKEYIDPYLFLYYLSNNTLLAYKEISSDSTCYICGDNSFKPAFFCKNNHFVHIDCCFQQILVTIKPVYNTFIIPNEPFRCDYCSDKFYTNE
jgi:hypothetical protein